MPDVARTESTRADPSLKGGGLVDEIARRPPKRYPAIGWGIWVAILIVSFLGRATLRQRIEDSAAAAKAERERVLEQRARGDAATKTALVEADESVKDFSLPNDPRCQTDQCKDLREEYRQQHFANARHATVTEAAPPSDDDTDGPEEGVAAPVPAPGAAPTSPPPAPAPSTAVKIDDRAITSTLDDALQKLTAAGHDAELVLSTVASSRRQLASLDAPLSALRSQKDEGRQAVARLNDQARGKLLRACTDLQNVARLELSRMPGEEARSDPWRDAEASLRAAKDAVAAARLGPQR